MKTSYDLEYLPERGPKNGSREAPEITEIKGFLACGRQNMCFEYDDEHRARVRLVTVQRFRNKNGLREIFECYRVDKCVYIVRTKKKSVQKEKKHANETGRLYPHSE